MAKKLKSINPLNLTEAYFKVQSYFFDYPAKEFSLNDLCASIKISKTTANKVVLELVKEGFLNIQTIGKLWRITCNQRHYYNTTRKIPYHLNLVYESEIVERISNIIHNYKAIILFGSYRKGDDDEKSDIDMAVEIIKDDALKIVRLGNIPRLGYRENVPINLHIFSKDMIDLNLFANIANGIVLYGFLEVRP
ncbi:MAG: nucleotidyltransferase domain-containing protein [Nanoarchaeota archaeon]